MRELGILVIVFLAGLMIGARNSDKINGGMK